MHVWIHSLKDGKEETRMSLGLKSTCSTKASNMQHDHSQSWEDWIEGEEERAKLQEREGERTESILELRERKSNQNEWFWV